MGSERGRAGSSGGRSCCSGRSGCSGSSGGGGENYLRRDPEGNGREQDRRDQGGPRRRAGTWLGGSEGARRGSTQDNQGRRDQAGGGRHEEKDRGRRRKSRS